MAGPWRRKRQSTCGYYLKSHGQGAQAAIRSQLSDTTERLQPWLVLVATGCLARAVQGGVSLGFLSLGLRNRGLSSKQYSSKVSLVSRYPGSEITQCFYVHLILLVNSSRSSLKFQRKGNQLHLLTMK